MYYEFWKNIKFFIKYLFIFDYLFLKKITEKLKNEFKYFSSNKNTKIMLEINKERNKSLQIKIS